MNTIGMMAMPAGFRYRDVFLKGRPQHEQLDAFLVRHPKMDAGRRAKIFAPFDALRGFNEAVAAKDELYEDRAVLSREDAEELSRKLEILSSLTQHSRMARKNRVQVTVTYFESCSDENHEAYGRRGRYRTVSGICRNVDAEVTRTLQVDGRRIPLDDIRGLETEGRQEDNAK